MRREYWAVINKKGEIITDDLEEGNDISQAFIFRSRWDADAICQSGDQVVKVRVTIVKEK